MEVADGIHPGFSRAQYDSLPYVNYSLIEELRNTPAHCLEKKLHPKPATDAMLLGTAVHCAVLEQEKFRSTYVVPIKVDRRTKEGKAAWEEFTSQNTGKNLVDAADHEMCLGMTESVYKKAIAREMLTGFGKNEVACVWTDKVTGLRCKALVDRICRWAGRTCVPDLKTCQDASPGGFAKAIYNLGYHERAAFYLWGLSVLAPGQRTWFWIAVEKERPYAVAVYEPDSDMLAAGWENARKYLDTYAECLSKDCWPGYSDGSVVLRLPAWANRERCGNV